MCRVTSLLASSSFSSKPILCVWEIWTLLNLLWRYSWRYSLLNFNFSLFPLQISVYFPSLISISWSEVEWKTRNGETLENWMSKEREEHKISVGERIQERDGKSNVSTHKSSRKLYDFTVKWEKGRRISKKNQNRRRGYAALLYHPIVHHRRERTQGLTNEMENEILITRLVRWAMATIRRVFCSSPDKRIATSFYSMRLWKGINVENSCRRQVVGKREQRPWALKDSKTAKGSERWFPKWIEMCMKIMPCLSFMILFNARESSFHHITFLSHGSSHISL